MTHPPPTAPDGPPINVVVTPVNTRTIKVTWDPPAVENRNGIITRYSVSYFPVGNSNVTQQLSTEATFLVVTAGITPDMEYNFTVAAITILIGPESSGIVQRSYPLPPLPLKILLDLLTMLRSLSPPFHSYFLPLTPPCIGKDHWHWYVWL